MRVREGGGGKGGKIRLVSYARFGSHRNAIIIEHAIITCHCVISGNAKLSPNKLGGAFGDGPVMFSLRSTIAQAQ